MFFLPILIFVLCIKEIVTKKGKVHEEKTIKVQPVLFENKKVYTNELLNNDLGFKNIYNLKNISLPNKRKSNYRFLEKCNINDCANVNKEEANLLSQNVYDVNFLNLKNEESKTDTNDEITEEITDIKKEIKKKEIKGNSSNETLRKSQNEKETEKETEKEQFQSNEKEKHKEDVQDIKKKTKDDTTQVDLIKTDIEREDRKQKEYKNEKELESEKEKEKEEEEEEEEEKERNDDESEKNDESEKDEESKGEQSTEAGKREEDGDENKQEGEHEEVDENMEEDGEEEKEKEEEEEEGKNKEKEKEKEKEENERKEQLEEKGKSKKEKGNENEGINKNKENGEIIQSSKNMEIEGNGKDVTSKSNTKKEEENTSRTDKQGTDSVNDRLQAEETEHFGREQNVDSEEEEINSEHENEKDEQEVEEREEGAEREKRETEEDGNEEENVEDQEENENNKIKKNYAIADGQKANENKNDNTNKKNMQKDKVIIVESEMNEESSNNKKNEEKKIKREANTIKNATVSVETGKKIKLASDANAEENNLVEDMQRNGGKEKEKSEKSIQHDKEIKVENMKGLELKKGEDETEKEEEKETEEEGEETDEEEGSEPINEPDYIDEEDEEEGVGRSVNEQGDIDEVKEEMNTYQTTESLNKSIKKTKENVNVNKKQKGDNSENIDLNQQNDESNIFLSNKEMKSVNKHLFTEENNSKTDEYAAKHMKTSKVESNMFTIDKRMENNLNNLNGVLKELNRKLEYHKQLKHKELQLKFLSMGRMHQYQMFNSLLQTSIELLTLRLIKINDSIKKLKENSESILQKYISETGGGMTNISDLPQYDQSEEEKIIMRNHKSVDKKKNKLFCPLNCNRSSCHNKPKEPTQCYKLEQNGNAIRKICEPFVDKNNFVCGPDFNYCSMAAPERNRSYTIFTSGTSYDNPQMVAIKGYNMHECLQILVVRGDSICTPASVERALAESNDIVKSPVLTKLLPDAVLFENIKIAEPGQYNICLMQFYHLDGKNDLLKNNGNGKIRKSKNEIKIMGIDNIGTLYVVALPENKDK